MSLPRFVRDFKILLVALSTLAQAQNPKILCLHGGGGSPTGMQNTPGIRALRNSLPSFDFVFAQGGYPSGAGEFLWVIDPPGGKGEPTTDPDIANASIENLDQIVEEQGPFYGILGYSQGSMFVPVQYPMPKQTKNQHINAKP